MQQPTPLNQLPDSIRSRWHDLLQRWAADGSLSRSAQEALALDEEPAQLSALVQQWSGGDFGALPPIELLPAASMPNALGAYATSTGTIYLNQDWLQSAGDTQLLAVLTEELGHHLDGLLNSSETPGDEGELFAALLTGEGPIDASQRQRISAEDDLDHINVDGRTLAIEQNDTVWISAIANNGIRFGENVAVREGDIAELIISMEWERHNTGKGWSNVRNVQNIFYDLFGDAKPREDFTYEITTHTSVEHVGTVTYDSDYNPYGANKTFNPNYPILSIHHKFQTVDDTTIEPDKIIVIQLNPPPSYATYEPEGARMVFITILNDDSRVSLDVSPYVDSLGKAVVEEAGNVPLEFIFSRTGTLDKPLTVNYQVSGAAIPDVVFTDINGTVALSGLDRQVHFKPGESRVTIKATPINDKNEEPVEDLSITLQPGEGYMYEGSPVTGFITDKFKFSTIELKVSPGNVQEDGISNLQYTFTRTEPISEILKVNYVVSPSSNPATLNTDYNLIPPWTSTDQLVTFPAGSSEAIVIVEPRYDNTIEPDETVTLKLVSAQGYNIGTNGAAVGTITNDDPRISITGPTAAVEEDSSSNLVFTVTRSGSGKDLSTPLEIYYSIQGTATADDYVVLNPGKPIKIGTGNSSGTLTVTPVTDSQKEPNETIVIQLEPPQQGQNFYTIDSKNKATGTILNDDPRVSLTVSPASVKESSGAALTYTFSRDGNFNEILGVEYGISGSAKPSEDYTYTHNYTGPNVETIYIPKGQLSASISFLPVHDLNVEPDETVSLRLTTPSNGNPYKVATKADVTGRILNDDLPTIALTVSPSAVAESSTTPLTYTFTRDGNTGEDINVQYTVGGTAWLDTGSLNDFKKPIQMGLNTITIPGSKSSATVQVFQADDFQTEANETVQLSLIANGSLYKLGTPNIATGTILNDDPPLVTISVSPKSIREDGNLDLNYTFSRSIPTADPLTVNYSILGNASLGDGDYKIIPSTQGTITIPANKKTATLRIDATPDNKRESDESVIIKLQGATPGENPYRITGPGAASQATGLILNDDHWWNIRTWGRNKSAAMDLSGQQGDANQASVQLDNLDSATGAASLLPLSALPADLASPVSASTDLIVDTKVHAIVVNLATEAVAVPVVGGVGLGMLAASLLPAGQPSLASATKELTVATTTNVIRPLVEVVTAVAPLAVIAASPSLQSLSDTSRFMPATLAQDNSHLLAAIGADIDRQMTSIGIVAAPAKPLFAGTHTQAALELLQGSDD